MFYAGRYELIQFFKRLVDGLHLAEGRWHYAASRHQGYFSRGMRIFDKAGRGPALLLLSQTFYAMCPLHMIIGPFYNRSGKRLSSFAFLGTRSNWPRRLMVFGPAVTQSFQSRSIGWSWAGIENPFYSVKSYVGSTLLMVQSDAMSVHPVSLAGSVCPRRRKPIPA